MSTMDEAKLSEIEARAKSAQSGPWLVCAAEDAADGLPVAFFGRGSGPKDVAVRSDGPPSGDRGGGLGSERGHDRGGGR